MRLQSLWEKHRGEDVYVIGTGPSSRCLDKSFFTGRTTIGLNQAYRIIDPTYSITVHPELYLEWKMGHRQQKTKWLVKRKAPMSKLSYDDPNLYVFETNDGDKPNDFQYLTTRTPDRLYQGRGCQVTAMCLAVHMGARSIILVGCDMGSLGQDHHGVNQHVRFNGLPPADVYGEYRRFTAKVRKVIRDTYRVPVLTMSPFLGVSHAEEDYQRLVEELRLPVLPPARDTSTYTRSSTDY